MILPIGDDNRDRRIFPFINYLLVILNIFVFYYYQDLGRNNNFTYSYSMVPKEIMTGKDIVTKTRIVKDESTGKKYYLPGLGKTKIPVYCTIITSMFMHGGLAHIIGNMIFLLIFGDNIENRIGHVRYLLFYLLMGVIASLSHIFATIYLNNNPLVPTLGASGAISGVLGAYLLLFPMRRVRVLFFFVITNIPAIFVIGIWFIFQLYSGMGDLNSESGVAYAAHIGGFVAGFLFIKFFDVGNTKSKIRFA